MESVYRLVSVFLMVVGLASCGQSPTEISNLEGVTLFSKDEQQKILGGLFPTENNFEKSFAGQYESRYLVDKPLPQIRKGSELVMLVEDSCYGRKEFVFYPDGTVTLYRKVVETEKKVYETTIKVEPKVIKKIQDDLVVLNFFDLSLNLINFKRKLLSNMTVMENRKIKTITRKTELEEDGFTLSLKVIHPVNKIYHTVHIYELETLKKQFPEIREYQVFDKCVQLVLTYIPEEYKKSNQ